MTDSQIRYWQMVEAKRHNQAQEEVWQGQLEETVRADHERERLTEYTTDVQAETARYVADTNAASSRYTADRHYAATVYSADKSAETQRYVADSNAAAQRYSANLNASTQRYVADQSAAVNYAIAEMNATTQRYVADTNATTQRYVSDQNARVSYDVADLNAATSAYRTDVESADRQARLAFDRQTQRVLNSISQSRLRLEAIRTDADTEQARAQTARIVQDTANSVEQLALLAKEYDLKAEAQKYENALSQARTLETYVKTADKFSDVVNKTWDFIDRVTTSIGGGQNG